MTNKPLTLEEFRQKLQDAAKHAECPACDVPQSAQFLVEMARTTTRQIRRTTDIHRAQQLAASVEECLDEIERKIRKDAK